MKSFLKIILSAVFFFSLTILNLAPIHAAGVECRGDEATIRVSDTQDESIELIILLENPDPAMTNAGDWEFKDNRGDSPLAINSGFTDFGGDLGPAVIFTIPRTTFEGSLGQKLTDYDEIEWWVADTNGDDCKLKFKSEDIMNAVNDAAGYIVFTGSGSTPGSPISTSCPGGEEGVITGLGCIPTQAGDLAKWLLGKAILMGGGIAFLLSLFGGITIILAGGNPEKINQGKEIIGSAVSGILFIIFSVLLLRLIGIDILQLPGFS